jgi:hypothetical protein
MWFRRFDEAAGRKFHCPVTVRVDPTTLSQCITVPKWCCGKIEKSLNRQ